MSDLIKHSKKALSYVLTVTTMVWSIGLFAIPVATQAAAGDLVKTPGNPAVYLVDADGVTIHPFPHANVYTSWGFPANFSSVISTDISGFKVGNDVEFRDGSLVRTLENPAVYFKSAGKLLPVVSANVFETLGYNYNNITWLPASFIDKYTKGATLTSTTTHPDGTLIKYANSSKLYLLQGGVKREMASTDVAKVNGYAAIPVITVPASETYSDGAKIVVKESSLTVPTGVGTAPASTTPLGSTQPVGSGLSVSLASDTPVAASIIDDSTLATTAGGAQAFVPFTKVALTAGSDGAVKVTGIKFKRGGISSDADMGGLYLYDGNDVGSNFIAQSTNFTTGVVTFTKSTGLVTVPAGTTKYLMLRGDLSGATGSGKTISFQVASASDITTDKAAVSGSFPLQGNTMSVAQAADLGIVTVANVSPAAAASVNPGTMAYEGWRFSLVSTDQDMEVRYLKIAMTGSAAKTDLKNFKLQVGGVDIAPTVAEMTDDREIIFNFTTPYVITKGLTKNVSLIFDVVSGSSRTIHLQIQNIYDVNVFDKEYKVTTKINQADSWTTIESNSATTNTSINSGSLTISKSTDSPTGNVAAGATGVVLAKFELKATGEDIRINSLPVISVVTSDNDIDNGKVYFDGAQVGSTADLTDAAAVTFSFGVSVVIPAGKTKVLEIRGDIKDVDGTNHDSGDLIAITLNAGSSNARALSSSTAISTGSVTSNTLTVSTGTLSVTENASVVDASASTPTGVLGQQNVRIGSFVVSAGAGEGVTVTQITMTDDVAATAGSSLADTFFNLRLQSAGPADANSNYAAGAAIGQTVGTLTDTEDTTYNFTPSPALKLGKSQQIIIDVYADILSSASGTQLRTVNDDTSGVIYPSTVTATGNDTSSSANGTMAAGLQNLYIASSGTLTVENVPGSSQVRANIVYENQVDVELYKFKMVALTEAVDVTRFIISDAIVSTTYGATSANGVATSTIYNFKLYDGTTLIAGPKSLTASSTPTNGGYIDFNLGGATPYRVNVGTEKVITLKGTISAWPSISSGSTHTFSLQTNPVGDAAATRAVTARGVGSSTALNGPTAVGTGNAITVRRAYPVLEKLALASNTLAGGSTSQKPVANFKVTAVGGQVRLKKMTFQVAWTDTTTSTNLSLSNFKLYRNGSLMGTTEYVIFDGTGTAAGDELSPSGTATLTSDGFSNTNGRSPNSTSTFATVLFGLQRSDIDASGASGDTGSGEEVIAAGSSNTYELKIDVANAHTGASTDSDSITVTLLGDDTQTQPLTSNIAEHTGPYDYRNGVIALNSVKTYRFIWSDYSANTNDHSSSFLAVGGGTGSDWAYGYQVPSGTNQASYIPLDAWTISK
ncbi:MAG: hypothetical protein AAB880_01665 [Patescibacteria group bacterium]